MKPLGPTEYRPSGGTGRRAALKRRYPNQGGESLTLSKATARATSVHFQPAHQREGAALTKHHHSNITHDSATDAPEEEETSRELRGPAGTDPNFLDQADNHLIA